jgi:hypothetical protein
MHPYYYVYNATEMPEVPSVMSIIPESCQVLIKTGKFIDIPFFPSV